jgi:hypothetical protein
MSDLEKAEWTRTLQKVNSLTRCEGFDWFMEKLRDKADALADQILHDIMSAEERENLRQQRMGILEVLRLPGDAEKVARIGLGESPR